VGEEFVALERDDHKIAYSYAHYFNIPIIAKYFTPNKFEILDHKYSQENCPDGKINIDGVCVCDPTINNSNCKNSDNLQNCPNRFFSVNGKCVDLKTLNRLNRIFWRNFRQAFKFWI